MLLSCRIVTQRSVNATTNCTIGNIAPSTVNVIANGLLFIQNVLENINVLGIRNNDKAIQPIFRGNEKNPSAIITPIVKNAY